MKEILGLLRDKIVSALGKFKGTVTISYKNIDMRFDTRNKLSKLWFYPRYFFGRPHEPACTKIVVDNLDKDGVFFDIGANLGYFTVLASKLCSEGEIHSFEIDPRLITLMKSSLELNNFRSKVYINCLAIANAKNQLVSFSPHQRDNLSTNKINHDSSPTKNVFQIKTMTLDEYLHHISSPPSFIKMDIEGAEALALEGMKNTLKEHRPMLLVEFHPPQIEAFGYDVSSQLKEILNHGYEAFLVKDHKVNYKLVPVEGVYPPQENFVCLFKPPKWQK